MSNDQTPADAAPYVQLFQKAHQKIVMLERLDEQVQQILQKRQELQDELRSIQSQLNEELDSRIKAFNNEPAAAARPSVMIAPEVKRGGRNQFSGAQTIESLQERAAG